MAEKYHSECFGASAGYLSSSYGTYIWLIYIMKYIMMKNSWIQFFIYVLFVTVNIAQHFINKFLYKGSLIIQSSNSMLI